MGERAGSGVVKRRGLLAGAAALAAAVAKLGTTERAEAAHGSGTDPDAIHRNVVNTATATTTLTNTNVSGGTALFVESTAGGGSGLHGANNTATGVGVHGSSSAGAGVFGLTLGAGKPGVSGVARGIGGIGVQAFASGGEASYAVQGIRESGGLGAAVRGDVNPGVAADAVQGAARSGIGVLGTSESGIGVRGEATTASGVHGVARGTATNSIGVLGEVTQAGGAIAVVGRNTDPANVNPAVAGTSPAGTGVRGNSTSGYGLFGVSQSGPGVFAGSISNAGVYADSGTSTGVFSTSTRTAVWGRSVAGTGVFGQATDRGVGVYGASAAPGWAGYFEGNVYVTGRVVQAGAAASTATTTDGSTRTVYSVDSAEPLVEDVGEGTLAKGRAAVALDAEFAAVADGGAYHVFLTPKGDCNGLYVASQTPAGFEVRELKGGAAALAFSYRVVAKRKGATGKRLEKLERPKGLGVKDLEPPKLPEAQLAPEKPATAHTPERREAR